MQLDQDQPRVRQDSMALASSSHTRVRSIDTLATTTAAVCRKMQPRASKELNAAMVAVMILTFAFIQCCGHSTAEVDGLKKSLTEAIDENNQLKKEMFDARRMALDCGKKGLKRYWTPMRRLVNEILFLKKELGRKEGLYHKWPIEMIDFWNGKERQECLLKCLGQDNLTHPLKE